MAQTEFRAEISKGTGFEDSRTRSMIAHDTSIAIFGPVVLSAGADNTNALPRVASTTTAGDAAVYGVCVALPDDGTIVADTSFVTVCEEGPCKVKVLDATVNLNDALETSGTAGVARVQPALAVRSDTLANLKSDVVTGLLNIRKCFAIALTAVTSGANSIVLAHVGINHANASVS